MAPAFGREPLYPNATFSNPKVANVGRRAGELISCFTLAISEGVLLYTLFRLVYPYPTHSSAIQKVADQYVPEPLPAFHTELFDLVRYGTATVWQRLRGREFEPPATPAAESIPHHSQRVGGA